MEKKLILIFLLGLQIQNYCQKGFTATVPCSDSLLMTIKGKYYKTDDYINSSVNDVLPKMQQPEAFLRMDAMHQLLLSTYPEPLGLSGKWRHMMSAGVFADDVNFQNGIPVCGYSYSCTFTSYTCIQGRPKDVAADADVFDKLRVNVNQWGELQNDYHLDTMSIDGRKVYMMNPPIGTWKGYQIYGLPGENFRCVVLSRKGESPFIPVTRKQYLEYSLHYLDQFFEPQIKSAREIPVRTLEEQETKKKQDIAKIESDYKSNPKTRDAVLANFLETYKTDQQQRDETVNIVIKLKKDVIKRYETELETNRNANMLEIPAEVFAPFTITESTPIFATGPEGGKLLVTANPSYIKKDLPKYVPQFMVLYWEWVSNFPLYGGEQGVYYRKKIETDFPIEKLQAMIDK